jgi:hypothetical protein
MFGRGGGRSFTVVRCFPPQRSTMFSSNAYAIRAATQDDQPVLRRLAELDSSAPLSGPALIGEIDGATAAALSLADGRVVADPFIATAHLAVHLRLRADGLLAHEREPSLAARIRAALLPVAARAAQAA